MSQMIIRCSKQAEQKAPWSQYLSKHSVWHCCSWGCGGRGGFCVCLTALSRGQMPTNLQKRPCRVGGDQLPLFSGGFRPAFPTPGCKGRGWWVGLVALFFRRCVSLCRENYSFPVPCAVDLWAKMDEQEFINELRVGNKVSLSSLLHLGETQQVKR